MELIRCLLLYPTNNTLPTDPPPNVANLRTLDQKNDMYENIEKYLHIEYRNLVCYDIGEALLPMNHAKDGSELLIKLSEVGIDDYSTHSTENGDKIIYSNLEI
ncbi:fam-a protein [Plasmodium yoelii]|uniref:Fam-a protein n=1 Tax=Plasmodium yoelii TaxID=5861 RepID=A0A4V6MA33_PLAYE|nr:fam-a protein [Plasmodium yoelii]VTZ71952.1 fam-a protein [Plasmodium yoelii]|eukprot:XP_034493357.1 fam-a protein [Plasmodium yoelii]